MESFEIPETPENWESAKAEQAETAKRLLSLLEDFERFDCWDNCFKQLDEAVSSFKTATAAVDLANHGVTLENGEE